MMERMTEWLHGHGALLYGDGYTKLARYEDTGLEPEEIEAILDKFGRGTTLRTSLAERIELIREISDDRLKEIVSAEKSGRLVIKPEVLDECCGSCANFEREGGTAHGICKVRKSKHFDVQLFVVQSRKSCKLYAKTKEEEVK